MRWVAALAALAVVSMGRTTEAQVADNAPTCRAERNGEDMITSIVFPDGYRVEGPWHVTGVAQVGVNTTMTAVLDHIVETRAISATRQMIELPGAIEMTFRANTMDDVLMKAADVWCVTVLHARATPPALPREQLAEIRTI